MTDQKKVAEYFR